LKKIGTVLPSTECRPVCANTIPAGTMCAENEALSAPIASGTKVQKHHLFLGKTIT
jgi:hypothetical protein